MVQDKQFIHNPGLKLLVLSVNPGTYTSMVLPFISFVIRK